MSLFTLENNRHFLKMKCLISSKVLFKYGANVPNSDNYHIFEHFNYKTKSVCMYAWTYTHEY